MKREQLLRAFEKLGIVFKAVGEDRAFEENLPIGEAMFEEWNATIRKQARHNGWFTEDSVRSSLTGLAQMLEPSSLAEWIAPYAFAETPKKVGIIMAGNLPLVGFHDFLAVVLSGHKAIVKLSSSDKMLFPLLLEILCSFEEDIKTLFELPMMKLGEVDALLATGSNNSMQYFESYFGHLPHIFRNNRTSLAILDGSETDEEIKALGVDIFTYFGLGCRNVSKLIFPIGFDINRFFANIVDYGDIVNHHKYANNYDYNKAIHLLNQVPILDNNFVILKETTDLFSPLAMIHYHYASKEDTLAYIEEHKEEIQVLVGHDYVPFGQAQFPSLYDYADGVNTLDFLQGL